MFSNRTKLSLSYPTSQTPPSSPSSTHSECRLTFAQFFEFISAAQALQTATTSSATEGNAEKAETKDGTEDDKPRETVYISVDEVWDASNYNYKIKESAGVSALEDVSGYAFVIRRKFDRKNVEFDLYIDIKSDGLRDVLRDVLKNIKAVNLREAKPTVDANILYVFLVHLEARRLAIENAVMKKADQLEHVSALIEFLKSHYLETTARLSPLLKHGEITYDLLWALFRPSVLVYTTCAGSEKARCARFDSGEYRTGEDGQKYFLLECCYLDYDGKTLGEARLQIQIAKFRDVRNINELIAFPLTYHKDEESLKRQISACGRKFVSLLAVHHRYFSGQGFYMHKGIPVRITVKCRIMIDAKSFKEANPNYKRPRIFRVLEDEVKGRLEDFPGDDTYLLICSPTVPGFSLQNKMWAEFPVADIHEIDWSASPYEGLILKKNQKSILLALSHSQLIHESKSQFDDFVEGKGRGLTILLHGEPGLGKTLTAEAMSENLKQPLYSISAGEIGHDAGQLEEQLSQIFNLAKEWNAVLLLDEADVFLESRSTENILRNSLVTVFLRRLEYYQGILFLTTNRMRNIDSAILSRIHYAIKYEELDMGARRHIWRSYLSKSCTNHGGPKITPEQFKLLLQQKLNGRQIKNIVRTADALAQHEERCLSHDHLQLAITAGNDFNCDFQGAGQIENLNSYT